MRKVIFQSGRSTATKNGRELFKNRSTKSEKWRHARKSVDIAWTN